MNKYSFLITVVSVLVVVDASPFLFDAIMTFSHMNLSNPLTNNIGDLRNAKSEHLSKSVPSEYNIDESELRNEATPGIFQKTVTKILQKLQFLAQLTTPISYETNTNVTADTIDENADSVETFDLMGKNNTDAETGRFSLAKVFESVIDIVGKMG
ncbi:hypothetical protein RN001_010676 [Aquatica leii]|uniref:Uncharacterized protein n=1 Tax=Aquatica leii TaxID=1421715 RepID=A0AAN7P1B8_9COLE|nr:hypothetical protein RN001_010676 [Aquatica leii]